MNQIIVREKYFQYWPQVAVLSLLSAIALFVIYQSVENILWNGYIRLASFSLFALSILSFFKVKDGQVEIKISKNNDYIRSVYEVRGNVIFEIQNQISDFYELKIDLMPDKSLYNQIVKSDKCVRFRREDENTWHYFNEIESRVIPLRKEDARRLYMFLKGVN